ncbi:MAG: MltA domain-containing protein [Thermodesulfobacteriota bacterium]|nr:MltA domain-containing protein [Thermodesulfobacteriota bacterium]
MANIAKIFILLSALALFACYPSLKKQVQRPEDALVPVHFFSPAFHDDMDLESLALAIKRNTEYLNRLDPEETFQYGPHRFTCQEVLNSQKALLEIMAENPDPDEFNKKIKDRFKIYRAAGRVGNTNVLFTGYFEPTYEASTTRDQTFKYPVYGKPDDLLTIDLSTFKNRFKGERVTARLDGREIVPYYSRRDIDMGKALEARGLEIAWLKDPVDVAFLQIQGSGRLRLPDGKTMMVGYIASNGRPYRSIGRYILDKGLLPKEEMSMQGIRRCLSEHPEMLQEILNHNPSYVFFQVQDNAPLGNLNVPVTPGRSVALDSKLFPKGALGFISCKKPVVNEQGEITEWKTFSRFVLNQDTGGAIKGAGRADLFWGSGPYAEIAAGHLQHEGELYILIKKP